MYLLRHGQSEFNVIYGETRRDPGIRDPKLTQLGKTQAEDAGDFLKSFTATKIVSSPYWRALETATIIAAKLKLSIEVTPLTGERAVFECDVGSPASQLREEFPHIDFRSLKSESWWPDREEDLESLDRRCQRFRQDCENSRYEGAIFVTHWGFIRGLTNIRAQNCGILEFDPASNHPGGGTVVSNCDPC
ncbi:MAG TPA: histidine phosphatase family protein [Rhodospirillaceae bacterium]|nr:hypothetical protein [Rhodospirillaceae bacterium]HAT35100.1 histidine phosphatase family protein [Rhodospirillaceae bacterium]